MPSHTEGTSFPAAAARQPATQVSEASARKISAVQENRESTQFIEQPLFHTASRGLSCTSGKKRTVSAQPVTVYDTSRPTGISAAPPFLQRFVPKATVRDFGKYSGGCFLSFVQRLLIDLQDGRLVKERSKMVCVQVIAKIYSCVGEEQIVVFGRVFENFPRLFKARWRQHRDNLRIQIVPTMAVPINSSENEH